DRKMVAANKALTYLKRPHAATDLINAARVLVFLKGSDAHDYKYSSAVLEDFYNISPGSRNRFMASSLFLLRSSTESDNGLVQRIRDALSNKKVF
ncbi:MAG: hypothetical protein HRU14_18510, partial [Planctomycetes bacterium]|nr:hypothetical protein [Planctomycetota bacterium]